MTESSDTKQRILDASLVLFSEYGFEATSVNQIAEAVGIRKASLYSHYAGKQEIFDAMFGQINEYFDQHSVFSKVDWQNPDRDYFSNMTADKAVGIVVRQITFLTSDPVMRRVRQLMTIEQYRNREIAENMEKRVYGDVRAFHIGLVRFLISAGVLEDFGVEWMADVLSSTVSMQIQRMDRDPGCEAQALEIIRSHIERFFAVFGKNGSLSGTRGVNETDE